MSQTPSFQISEIFLLDSQFKREHKIDFQHPSFKNKVSIETDYNYNEENKILEITVLLNFSAGISNKKYISAKIIMVGIFNCSGDAQLSVEQFSKANGPAIMFPFLREHLASVSLKAGIKPILLPAINFIKLAAENKIKKIAPKPLK
ncbi:protein-export chaperone SecB [Pedobacter metabolipauper]|uniref:Protein translocase subunit secB n=1 Tax=Pedobacter metabolipauper TaxID=425513 RepID=A0A4R6SQH8_9SPHI|nr:protein-export chaperone SecB [Pedobacter metabolipauper]TDQ06241.1 protein translocase subunit secB [Pedobacter metabolipauper]